MLGLIRGRLSDALANVFPAREVHAFIAPDIELSIIEQRKVDLVAHRGNIGLVEQEIGGMSPALAVLGPLMRQRDNVVGSLANGAQNRPALDR